MAAGIWNSAHVPAPLRAQAVRHMLSEVHLPWSLDLGDRDLCECRLDWHGLGDCTVIKCRSDRLAGSRGASDIRQTEGEHFGLLLILAGSERVRQEDTVATLGPGDLLLWDSTRPIRFEVTRSLEKITLLVPREKVERATVSELRGATRLEGRSGLGALVAAHLSSLTRIATDIPPDHARLASDVLVDLLGRMLDPQDPGPQGGDLVERIARYIDDNLADPALTPTRIATRFGITPRYLHMTWSAAGRTVSAHIRSKRLAAIRRDLADPRLARHTITDIAFAWGFSDAAHTSRAFSTAFGLSPSEYRATCRR